MKTAEEIAGKLSHSCMQRNHYTKIAQALTDYGNQRAAQELESMCPENYCCSCCVRTKARAKELRKELEEK